MICPNCDYDDGVRDKVDAGLCRECGWPLHVQVPAHWKDKPICSICRRRHGNEIQHACE